MNPTDLTSRLALDSRGFESLKQTARTDPTGAAKTVAKQFDAIFVNMMLKQMRDASPQNGPLDSSSSKMYTSMLDQQLSQTMASRGVGVADQLLKQMLRQANRVNPDAGGKVNTALSSTTATNTALPGAAGSATDAAKAIARASLNSMAASAASGVEDDGSGISTVPRPGLEARVERALAALRKQAEAESKAADMLPEVDLSAVASEPRGDRMASFYNKLIGHASQAAQETGIPANFMIGHAALESGWGRREIKAKDGSNTHNLFGIKAGGSWTGKTAEVTTTEYIGGVARKVKEKFRAYSSYAEAFKDYANLLANNPRYSHVVAAGNGNDAASFAKGLQRAGYATDPNYAHKIMAVLKQIV
ncbi:flagellar assembly peptidoglycan hydrolase FlgJ [Ralstonia mannitolilytica]|uniref:Peptidoglycan hydrolase FlgJ n=1 Tax=Ralstonia mannitolilytica TaxID=105219 RepID=A0AAD2ARH6_9RALS|nr:flagellar assembly peptidoglycan hydrolase FlgJ [Ralstonia mannitolilytica]ATG22144.1 flagellar assembly peptidoglycan hydrolase FlgJ [Ralstonia pickettii]ANA36099.1 flagellar rod assembly protein FlgJ [Ralstonia mannitolilytica]MBY4717216.1 flagellar assembly peptidoglycan hydrolase FlgJ [Ralstonia mannitolilytica]CAJ0684322.1 Peptidoglycan hydrolase FlgJ [Ralstonia mannitolilytica]CAJ0687645.1 Peptidoglycan hydrolase FlgJ [Ralstonia mannitolilytica]